MKKVMVLGAAGKIGSVVTEMLAATNNYFVYAVDIDNVPDHANVQQIVGPADKQILQTELTDKKVEAVISCLPYYMNIAVLEAILSYTDDVAYFDLTEDRKVAEFAKRNAEPEGAPIVPQCGLAPGFVSIAAWDLIEQFDEVDVLKIRVGALPQTATNRLKYALTWSTNGLINECGNPCEAVRGGKIVEVPPLSGHETITIDGTVYEAFTTSGGIGSLTDSLFLANKLPRVGDYKTLRYPGHRELFQFLMEDLALNYDRGTLERILENALPTTKDDVVVIHISVIGKSNGNVHLEEKTYTNKIYGDGRWTAIQQTTAAGVCGVVEVVLSDPDTYNGFVRIEDISLKQFMDTQFGWVYND